VFTNVHGRPSSTAYGRRAWINDLHHNLDKKSSPPEVLASYGSPGAAVPVAVFGLIGHPAGPYSGHVTELPIDDAAGLASAAHDAAERGQVIYLTDPQGRRIAAIVPASVAAAGAAAIGALEDAADVAVAEEALAEWEADDRRTYRLADVDAELSES
jgi:hypothetical protein